MKKILILLVFLCLVTLTFSRLGTGEEKGFSKFRRQARFTGTVKRWSDRGFGYIRQDSDPYKDIFTHLAYLREIGGRKEELIEGQRVEYSIKQGPKSLVAYDVIVIPI